MGMHVMPHQIVTQSNHIEMFRNEGNLHLQIPNDAGYTTVPLAQANSQIDNYIRSQIPGLQSAVLVSAETQSSNGGTNYIYTYSLGTTLYSVLVWDQTVNNLRQIQGITRVDTNLNSLGQVVRNTTITRLSPLTFMQEANLLFP
jgi:hypothetical protein